jgi:3-methyladenine DNA glycosylase AlkD
VTELSDELLGRITERFEAARDGERAGPMAAYMRDQFAFLGIPTPERVRLSRDAVVGLGRPGEADLVDLADALWARDEREYQYAGLWLLRRHQQVLTPGFIPTAHRCITRRSWWDTVDGLAQHVVGFIVHQHRELGPLMADWLVSDDLWLARTAILH